MVAGFKCEAQKALLKVCSPDSAAVEDMIVTKYFNANDERRLSLSIILIHCYSRYLKYHNRLYPVIKSDIPFMCFTDL